jgi:hypothetical protein
MAIGCDPILCEPGDAQHESCDDHEQRWSDESEAPAALRLGKGRQEVRGNCFATESWPEVESCMCSRYTSRPTLQRRSGPGELPAPTLTSIAPKARQTRSTMTDCEIIAHEVSRYRVRLERQEVRLLGIDRVNARLRSVTPTTSRWPSETSRRWSALYQAMRRPERTSAVGNGHDDSTSKSEE